MGMGGMGMFGGMRGMRGGFGMHFPRSDPEIPPVHSCLECGKQEDSDIKLLRCSCCKLAMFCDIECQKKCWASHKKICKQLKELFDTGNPNKLKPVRCQIIRSSDGATIKHSENMIPSEITSLRTYDESPLNEIVALLLGTHDRLGEFSKVHLLKGFIDIFIKIYSFLYLSEAARYKRLDRKVKICGQRIKLSTCAADHMSVIKNLTNDQLKARYPLACIERWGGDGHNEEDENDGCTSLVDGLGAFDSCVSCGSDGEQWFSFCLNRMVNADRVHHCDYCGKCFYYRPGCMMGCPHCNYGLYLVMSSADVEDVANLAGISINDARKLISKKGKQLNLKHVDIATGCNVPEFACYETKGLAAEGYWGY